MTYLDVYKSCEKCVVRQYCGTMIQSTRLCYSCQQPKLKPKNNNNYKINEKK